MNRWRRSTLAALGVGLALSVATTAVGSPPEVVGKPLLDQFNPGTLASTINGGSSPYKWQQGVTAGIAGQLTRIDLFVVIDAVFGEVVPTEVSVTLGAPWQEGAPVWSTPATLRSEWNTFNMSNAKIFLDVGDEYAIGIHGESQDNFNPGVAISYDEQYPAGDLFLNGSSTESVGRDLLFRTYVRRKHAKGD